MTAILREIDGKNFVVVSIDASQSVFHPSAAERFAKEILEAVKQARDADRRQVKRFFDP